MGGLVSNSCNHLTKEIWTYCTDQKIWLSAVHIPGKDNNTADYMSRLLNENTERAPFVFHKIVNVFKVTPEIDLFASALNHQVPKYISWNPDQEAFAVDAYHIKNRARRCIWGHDYPLVEHTILVPNDGLTSPGFPCNSSTKHPSITIQLRSAISTLYCWQFIYQQIP